VTVIIYNQHKVVDSKDYKRGEFDEKAAAAVLKKVDELMARINKKPAAGKKQRG
jgi:tetrahydromethanopterin S-methyltransferase subunit H